MQELSTDTSIAEIEAQSPSMLAALKASGLFREGNRNITVGELCLNFGLHPRIILDMLQRAGLKDPSPEIDISDIENLELPEIVNHIETVHHQRMRQTLPGLVTALRQVVDAHAGRDERLRAVRSLFEKMATELENHMLHEEEALFPMCRDMVQSGHIKATPCGDRVGGPIQCMKNDHDQVKEELGRLGELTDNFVAPAGADMRYTEVLQQLEAFAEDLVLHIHKEDHLLFPRALQLQAQLRARSPNRTPDR